MKKVLLLIITLAVTISLSAQNWTKAMQRDFRKSKDIVVVVDFSKATIMGVPTIDFPYYYAGKYQTNDKYPVILLNKIKTKFESTFYQTFGYYQADLATAKYIVHYDFHYINEKGGFSGVCYVSTNGNNSTAYYFGWKDGRWNDFEQLVMENIKRYFGKAKKYPNFIGGKLYKK